MVEIFLVDADIGVLSDLPAIADAFKSLIHVAAAAFDIEALRVLAAFGDDIDHPIDGIGTPKRGSGAADDFNPVNIFQEQILHVPINAREGRRINASSIDEDQEFVGESIIETAG